MREYTNPYGKAVHSAQNKAVTSADNKDLSELTVAELRDRAKDEGVTGYSSMTKAELVEALGG